MQYSETDISPSRLHWGENEQIMSAHVPLMTGTEVSRIPGIPASVDIPVSCAQANGNGSMSSTPSG